MPLMHRMVLLLTVCSWAGLSALIAWLFHVKSPQPYMVGEWVVRMPVN
jgi:hypothetical protein